jgi:hypothetical protein
VSRLTCPDRPVQAVLFQISVPGYSILAVLSRLSCPCYSAYSRSFRAAQSRLSFPAGLSHPYFPSCSILTFLSSTFGPGCPRPGYIVLAVQSWLSCHGCILLTVVLAIFSWLSCPGCPVLAVLAVLSWLPCPGCSVPAACLTHFIIFAGAY